MLARDNASLLAELQDDFPLSAAPYAEISRRVGVDEAGVIKKVRQLLGEGTIRYIGAVFNNAGLGRSAALVGMQVPEGRLGRAVAVINGCPWVSHNYLRADAYNLWFTLSAGSPRDLRRLFERIKQDTGISKALYLSTRRVVKIDARFAIGRPSVSRSEGLCRKKTRVPRQKFSQEEIKIIAVLNQPWPIHRRPFGVLAEKAGCSEDKLIGLIRKYASSGLIRRWGAILAHRRIGLKANVLVAWKVPAKQLARVCHVLADEVCVSHCYVRDTAPEWPYNVYCMLHGSTRSGCLRKIASLAGKTGIKDKRVLFTLKEFKKTKTAVAGGL
jgi:DNA-binding Lrp family transcriptional regulator